MATKRRKRRRPRRQRWETGLTLVAGALLGVAAMWGLQHVVPPPKHVATTHLDPLTTPPQGYPWTALPEPAFPIPPYARFLAGVRIVLDPGHVGQRDPGGSWKRGPTGLREAEVNLRVAHFLRELLNAAGAKVVLTREQDESLDLSDKDDLRQRVEVANKLPADLLLSIHHNADGNPQPNYSAVFYHGSATDNPASLSAGRYLVTGLNDALRLESHLECALLSDFAVYERNGFAVLRQAEVPAVLSEASFHSNPAEEARLRDPVYNRREAYGLFLGLARWAQAGLPRIALVHSASGESRHSGEVVVGLDDGLSARGGWGAAQSKILPESLVVKLDGQPVRYKLDVGKRQLRVSVPAGSHGRRRTLFVDFENIFGQHVLHPRFELH
jgi:N-acetylmuramoyl-L-alanine amidase